MKKALTALAAAAMLAGNTAHPKRTVKQRPEGDTSRTRQQNIKRRNKRRATKTSRKANRK